MWTLIVRAPAPDAPYWPGRRLLAIVDAVVWPLACTALVIQLLPAAGIVGPTAIAIAAIWAAGRVRRALWMNRRYFFITWRLARWLSCVAVIGVVLQLALRA